MLYIKNRNKNKCIKHNFLHGALYQCPLRPSPSDSLSSIHHICLVKQNEYLRKAEVLASLCDGFHQKRAQSIIALILRKVQFCLQVNIMLLNAGWFRLTIKARVRRWQAIFVTIIAMYVEPVDTVHAF
jgi:hypothetical protein